VVFLNGVNVCVIVGEEGERDAALHCIIIMVACFKVGREGGREGGREF